MRRPGEHPMQAERVLATLCVALAPWQEVVVPTAEARWPIGLFAVQVSEAPRENVLASRLGWIGDSRTMRFEVEPDGAALRVRIVESSDFTSTFVELCLDASGARAAASDRSCVSSWSGAALAGTACLVTDGKTAAVEFELYDGAEVWYQKAFFGRVDARRAWSGARTHRVGSVFV